MFSTPAPPQNSAGTRPLLSRRQVWFDVLLAVVCLAVTLVVNLSGSQSVSANRDPDVLTVALTVMAVGSLAARRRFPLTVLAMTLAGVVGLMVVKAPVGMSTIGPFIATYTALTHGSARHSRHAIALVALTLALTALIRPVDLNREGAVVSSVAFVGVVLLATSTRARRERAEADVRAAEQQVLLERERADAEQERTSLVTTRERLRITRELHDVIGHAMSVMIVQAGAAGRLLDTGDPPRARSAVTEIETTGRRAMAEMRSLLGILRDGGTEGDESPRAPAPTLDDLRPLVARVGQAGIPTTMAVHGTPFVVPPGVGLAAYRIVQEALTNCLKHSSATCASVDLTYRHNEVEIVVTDDGKGPDRGVQPATGHGVAGMRERVSAYGGDLTIGERPGGGFRVLAVLPVGARP